MKYTINNIEFKNKEEITNKCREISERNQNQNLMGDDLNFMMEIFKYHPNKDVKFKDMKSIFVGVDKYKKNYCFFIEKNNGLKDDISFSKCILHIPFNEEFSIDFQLPFGKYKGESVYDIYEKDKQYLEWLSEVTKDREIKIKIHQILRYGFIPFNPIMAKFER